MATTDAATVAPEPLGPPTPAEASISDLVGEPESSPPRVSRPLAIAAGVATALVLVGFVLLARVPIGAGWRTGRSLPVQEIWWLFTHELSSVAGDWLSPVLVTLLVVLSLAGCAALVGLAMLVPDQQTEPGPE